MKYRLPEDCTGVTYVGTALDKASDGTVEAAPDAALDLAPHGIVPVTADDPVAGSAASASKADDRRMLR